MITISGVSRTRRGQRILDDVTFAAEPGRVTGLLGLNGAGKSSTMRVLLGLDRADGGSALIGGRRYRDIRRPLLTVGAVLDGSGAHRSRTARGHLAWVAASNGIPRRRVGEVIELVGLAGASRKPVVAYSLGMGQRLALATALLGRPEVLVLDEPTNGLDPEGIRWLRGLMRHHAGQGGTVLVSSHHIAEMDAVADDLVVMAEGRVVATGSVDEVAAGHAGLEDAFFALAGGAPGARRRLDGVESSDEGASGAEEAVGMGAPVRRTDPKVGDAS